MRRIFFAILASLIVSGASVTAEQYPNIKPEWKCHYLRKDRSICKVFPNFALRKGLCNPEPAMLGHIVWCREDITVTEQDDCGEWETYEAVVVTYRQVYANGAWGKKFKRTFRKEPKIVTPPVIYK